jgi:hypothetical protein
MSANFWRDVGLDDLFAGPLWRIRFWLVGTANPMRNFRNRVLASRKTVSAARENDRASNGAICV